MSKEKRNIVKLYNIPYGKRFRVDGVEYIHERGDGMYPKIRRVDNNEQYCGHIGMLVEKVND